jgi:transposase-like protein
MGTKASIVREMLLAGAKYPEISRVAGVASSTIAYHAEKLGLRKRKLTEQKRYDWKTVQAYYDQGYSISEVVEHFGMHWSSLRDARTRGDIHMDDRNRVRKVKLDNGRTYSDEFMFREDSTIARNSIRKRFREITLYACSNQHCTIFNVENPVWAGNPLVLHLDHINGIRNDHRVENLRWLCPNCHSQTPTYCGKNIGK